MSIGDNIRKRRKELKLTQTKLGQLVHKSSQVISNWERGYTTGITIEDLIALADALKISILSLIPHVKDDSNSYREEQASFETDYINTTKVAENITNKRLLQLINEYPHLDEKSKPSSMPSLIYLKMMLIHIFKQKRSSIPRIKNSASFYILLLCIILLLEFDELIDASAALDHGFDEAAPDVEDDDARMVAVFEGFLEGFGKFILCGDGLRLDAETLGVLDVIHRVVELAGNVALFVHDLLELADHAETPVVDDQGDDGQIQACNRIELIARHLDAAVTGYMDDTPVFAVVELSAHRGRQAESHRAEAAGGQPRPRLFDAQVERSPHLMLPDIRHKGVRLALRALHDLMHRPRDSQAVLVIVVGIGILPLLDLLPPVRQGGIRLMPHEQGKYGLHIAGKAERVADVLVYLGWVDVDVDELRVLRVLVEIARLAVAEAAADGDDEVCRGNRVIGGLLAVHAGKTE